MSSKPREPVYGAFRYTKKQQPNGADRLPDWDDFRVLMTVLKMGSFNRAASALGMTQPTVSRRVKRLEKAMRKQIFDRSTTGAVLTVDGQRIVEELRIAYAALSRAVDQAPARQTRMEDVKLVMTDGIAAYWVTNFLPALGRMHPSLQVRLFATNDTVQGRGAHFDLSIQFITPNDPHLVAARLGTLHFVPYASQAYLDTHGTPRTLADLESHRLLDFIPYLIDKGSWSTRLPGTIGDDRTMLYANSSSMLCEAVRRGNGIALLPTYATLFETDLIPLPELGLNYATPFWVCYPDGAMKKHSAQIALQFLKHIFSKRMPWFADRYIPPAKFPTMTAEEIMQSFTLDAEDAAKKSASA